MNLGTYLGIGLLGSALVLNPVQGVAGSGRDKVREILDVQQTNSTVKINPDIKQESSFSISMQREELGKLNTIDLNDTNSIIYPNIYTSPKQGDIVFVIYPIISNNGNENAASLSLGIPYNEVTMRHYKVLGIKSRHGGYLMILLAKYTDDVEGEDLNPITLIK